MSAPPRTASEVPHRSETSLMPRNELMQCSKWPWPPVTPSARVAVLFRSKDLGIRKDGRKRSAAAVRKRIHPALAIVCDEPPDGHGLHRMVGDANRAVNNAGRDAEQNHAVLGAEGRRRLFHYLSLASSLGRLRSLPHAASPGGRWTSVSPRTEE